MELKYSYFKSQKNTKIILSKQTFNDGTKTLIIHIKKVVPKEGYVQDKQYHIVRTFFKALYVEVYICLKEETFGSIMLFNLCNTIEELDSFKDSKEFQIGIKPNLETMNKKDKTQLVESPCDFSDSPAILEEKVYSHRGHKFYKVSDSKPKEITYSEEEVLDLLHRYSIKEITGGAFFTKEWFDNHKKK